MLTHYQSSKGPMEISKMVLSYALNARNKLQCAEPERATEIEALTAHIEKLQAEATEKTMAGDVPVRDGPAPIGDNGAPDEPALDGREAIEAHVADLLVEAANWADGFVIENQTQADAVGRLMRKLQQAAKLVDDAAAEEKKPLNEVIAEISTWQNAFTAKGLKKTPDGKLTKAILATGNMSTAWLRKQDDERRKREQEAAAAAAKAAQEALASREKAKTTTDLAAMDKADDLLADAEALIRQAKGVAKERVSTGGGDGMRAVGMRSVWSAVVTDRREALLHYIKTHRDEFDALVETLAARDARNEAMRRKIPGVTFVEQKVAI